MCVLMMMTPIRAGELEFRPAAGYAFGALVVCVGGYCLYKVVKICQKKFPPKKSGETNSFWLTAAGEDEYAGAYEYSSIGSCEPPSVNVLPIDDNSPATTFTIHVLLNNGEPSVSMSASNQEAQSWDQFASEMAEHGLFLTGHASYEPQFSRNRIPCDSASVPMSFEPNTGRVIHHVESVVRVTVERSPNLQDWYPLLVTDTGENSRFGVVDTTVSGQMFYRVTVR